MAESRIPTVNPKALCITVLPQRYAVCQLAPGELFPQSSDSPHYFAEIRTQHEVTLVCLEDAAPPVATIEGGWRVLEVEGPLQFELVGILASISTILAGAGVSIFAQSTFNTDYILVKEEQLNVAVAALRAASAGYVVVSDIPS